MNKPWRVTIDTNPDQCNLNCIMCDTHSIYNENFKPSRKAMDKKLLVKSLEEAFKLGVKEIIPTTMGEPLLYSYMDAFIDKLSQNNTKLNLTTNGTFPNIGVEKWAEKLLPILSDIKISLNSINPGINESIMINDDTEKKVGDIKKFVKLRDKLYPNVSITLQVTFLKATLNELEKLIQFAIENNINRVKGHQLWITHDEIKEESLQNSSEKIDKWNNFIDYINKYRDKIELVNFEKLEQNNNQGYVPEHYSCPFLSKELWINHNGDFNICCAPSDKRATLGNWGNIEKKTIEDLFDSKEYLNLIENYKEQDVCKICSLRKA